MKKIGKVFWLVFLSIFPISTLLQDVELEKNESERSR